MIIYLNAKKGFCLKLMQIINYHSDTIYLYCVYYKPKFIMYLFNCTKVHALKIACNPLNSSQWCSARHLRVLSKLMSCVIFCHNSCGQSYDIMVSGKWYRPSGSSNILIEILTSTSVPNISLFYLLCNSFMADEICLYL